MAKRSSGGSVWFWVALLLGVYCWYQRGEVERLSKQLSSCVSCPK